MKFSQISSEQAMSILSHIRAIAQLTGQGIEAYVSGEGRDENNEIVFLTRHMYKVLELPTRKYFRITLSEEETCRVRFDDTLDLLIEMH